MPQTVNIIALIPFLTLLQGFLFAILLIYRGYREERYTDFWLALALFLLSINGVPYLLGWLGIEVLWEKFTYLPWDGFWLAVPPTIYLFLKSLSNDQWRFSFKRDIWHYTPYGLYFFEHLIVGSIGLSNKAFLEAWTNHPVLELIQPLMKWSVDIFYFVMTYRLYQSYKKWTFNEFSDPDRMSFTWLRNFLVFNLMLTLINIANFIVVHLSPEKGNAFYALMWWGYLMDTLLMYYLSISGYMQARVKTIRFDATPLLPLSQAITLGQTTATPPETQNETLPKNKNLLSEADLAEWKNKILAFFDEQKPYLNPELTLSELADNLHTNSSVLSQVINNGFEKNFNDFVNHYRVADFKQKAKSPEYQHLTLLAIAFDCGFNSKATFNRAFKKITGQNPSDF